MEKFRNLKRSDVTYGQLDKLLRSLGFKCRSTEQEPPGRVYEHDKSGAIVALPSFPDDDQVFAYHLITVQGELESFGIADPMTFDKKLHKVG